MLEVRPGPVQSAKLLAYMLQNDAPFFWSRLPFWRRPQTQVRASRVAALCM